MARDAKRGVGGVEASGIAMNYRHGLPLRMILWTLLLAGCTTHGRIGTLPPLSNHEPAAEIVVIRTWHFVGSARNVTVVLDGLPLYGLSVDEHVVLRVPSGDHILTISRRDVLLNDAAAAVRAEPKQRYYYRLEMSTWSGDISLLPVAP